MNRVTAIMAGAVAVLGFSLGQTPVLRAAVVDGGGGSSITSLDYRCGISVAQQIASGLIAGGQYQAVLGFWHPPYAPPGGVSERAMPNTVPAAIRFELGRNHPNPFGRRTVIKYSLPQEAEAQLRVYDPAGRAVATLIRGRQKAGRYAVTWDVGGVPASVLPSGTYFYRLEAGEFTATEKLVKLE